MPISLNVQQVINFRYYTSTSINATQLHNIHFCANHAVLFNILEMSQFSASSRTTEQQLCCSMFCFKSGNPLWFLYQGVFKSYFIPFTLQTIFLAKLHLPCATVGELIFHTATIYTWIILLFKRFSCSGFCTLMDEDGFIYLSFDCSVFFHMIYWSY